MLRALATLAVPALAFLPLCGQEGYRSNAKYVTEADAEARAAAIDVGTAEFVGPSTATVGDYGSFRLRFTVGEAGMAIGGGLRLATQHDFGWDMWGGTRLQEDAPAQPNFLTYSTSTGSRLSWRSDNSVPAYFPWQRVNQFILEGPSLREGDWIEVVFGDRSGGSPGVEIQPMDESEFEQRVFVDAAGDGDFLPLADSPTLQFVGAAARDMVVVAPTDWEVREDRWVNVWFDDGLGNPASGYGGTVTLAVDADGVRLPPPRRYRESDRGAYRFEGVSFGRPGTYRVIARDTDGREARSNPIVVHAQSPPRRIYWGDLHTQIPSTPMAAGRPKRCSISADATPPWISVRSATTPSSRRMPCGRTSRQQHENSTSPAST